MVDQPGRLGFGQSGRGLCWHGAVPLGSVRRFGSVRRCPGTYLSQDDADAQPTPPSSTTLSTGPRAGSDAFAAARPSTSVSFTPIRRVAAGAAMTAMMPITSQLPE